MKHVELFVGFALTNLEALSKAGILVWQRGRGGRGGQKIFNLGTVHRVFEPISD